MPPRPTSGRPLLFLLLALTLLPARGTRLSADEPSLPAPPPADSGLDTLPPAGPSEEPTPSLAPPPEPETAPLAPSTDSESPLAPEQPKAPSAEKAPEPAPTPKATPEAEASPKAVEPKTAEPKAANAAATEPKPDATAAPEAKPTPEAGHAAEAAPVPTPSASPSKEPESLAQELSPPAPSPTPAPEQAETTTSEYASFRHHGQIPEYQKTRPQWGVELTVSPSALGTNQLTSDFTGNPLAYELSAEFQPAFLQGLGVLGFGPVVGLYAFPADQNIALATGVWTVGAEARWQARFFREQIVVPVAGYAFEYIHYHFEAGSGNTGSVEGDGPILGLYVLLNQFEPGEAEEMFKENGVSRSYFVAEARDLMGSDGYLSFSGFSYFFGLRIEF